MEFNYSEEQLALQDTLQRFISRDYDFDKRRAILRRALGYSAEAWKQYAELGLLALPFPEEFGGLSGTGVDIMVVMEQFGQGLLLEPFLSTVVTCGGLLRDAASEALKQKLVPQIAAGELKLSLAAYEAAGRYDLSYVACTARQSGGGWRLSGRKTVVLDGASADYFLVSARSSGKTGERDGVSLFLVPRDAKGLTIAAYPTQSGARAADLILENVAVGADALIGAADARFGFDRARRRSRESPRCAPRPSASSMPESSDPELSQDAQAIRRRDRNVSGAEAQDGGHADRCGAIALHGHHRRGTRGLGRCRRAAARDIRSQSLYRAGGAVGRSAMPCRCTAAWASWTNTS